LKRGRGPLPGTDVASHLERRSLGVRLFSAYDEGVKQIHCVCGRAVKGEDDDELWRNAQEHMLEDHPDLAGKVSREDLLAQAEEVPRPTS
jgi:2-oxo-4-hydroxy-4-carboxy--5-ureidoimidazoline (OHCU) decarboxylase